MTNDTTNNLAKMLRSIERAKSNGALGKGLSALLNDVNIKKGDSYAEVVKIDLEKCLPSKYQARTEFNEEELFILAESIKTKGVIQPILLRKLNQDSYEIIAGERRCRAAKIAGLKDIPAMVMNFSDKEVMEIGLIENLQRKDLNPLEEAKAYKHLLDSFSYSHEDISKLVGKSRSYISNYLRILSLPQDVLHLISSGQLSAGHAKALVNSNNPSVLAKTIIEEGLSVRNIESLSKRSKDKEKSNNFLSPKEEGTAFKMKAIDPFILTWYNAINVNYDNLEVSVYSKVEGEGEIKIKYKSIQDLKTILKTP